MGQSSAQPSAQYGQLFSTVGATVAPAIVLYCLCSYRRQKAHRLNGRRWLGWPVLSVLIGPDRCFRNADSVDLLMHCYCGSGHVVNESAGPIRLSQLGCGMLVTNAQLDLVHC